MAESEFGKSAQQNNSSLLRLLVVLVVLLSLLLLISAIGIGVLLTVRPGAESDIPQAAEIARDQPSDNATALVPSEPQKLESRGGRATPDNSASANNAAEPAPQTLAALPNQFDKQKDSSDSPWRYRLNRKEPLVFDYSFTLSLADEFDITNTRRTTYRMLDDDPVKFLQGVSENQGENDVQNPFALSGNGNGFVIHPQGLIATCAHVVSGVDNVSIRLDDKVYSGVVAATDQQHDLALVKIDVDEPIAYLKLASSDPSLGSAARVFGFPLAE